MQICPMFKKNTAFKFGGALFFQDHSYSNSIRYIIVGRGYDGIENFKENTARKFGGAIMIHGVILSEIENIMFSSNKAFLSGGAIYANNSSLSIIKCSFNKNTAGTELYSLHTKK